MRLPKFKIDSTRLWYNLLIVTLFVLLYVFPKPDGAIFSAARIIIAFGIVFALFYNNGITKKISPSTVTLGDNSADSFNGNHSIGQSRYYYDKLLGNIFDIIQAMNSDFSGAVYMIDPLSNGYTLQKATDDLFYDFVGMENDLYQVLLSNPDSMLFQQKEMGDSWSNILKSEEWLGSECILGTRIIFRNSTVGTLLIYSDHFNKFKERDREIISSLGVFVSEGIENLERTEELVSDRENHTRITDMLNRLNIENTRNDIFEAVRTLCHSLFFYDKLTISMRSTYPDTAKIVLVDGFTEDITEKAEFKISDSLHGRPVRTGKPIRTAYWDKDYDDTGRFIAGDSEQFNFMSVVGVPIGNGTDTQGALVLERLSSRIYSESDQWLLESLAQTIYAVMEWSDKYQIVYQHATHDGLTELLNHKSFLERFEEEISRSLRFQQDLVLLMMDLDKFKRINDNHGHLYGDYVLYTVALVLKSCIRNIDVIARYGGEEFAILLINTDKRKAQAVADRIVKSVAGHKFHKDNIDARMTISVGLAQFPEDADRIKDMIARADAAMYRVKGKGGNGTLMHNPNES